MTLEPNSTIARSSFYRSAADCAGSATHDQRACTPLSPSRAQSGRSPRCQAANMPLLVTDVVNASDEATPLTTMVLPQPTVLGVSLMTKAMALTASFGLLLAALLILSQGTMSVFGAVANVGVGAVWICVIRCLQTAGAGWAWWILLPGARSELLKACLGLRWVREAINTLLPVAQ